MASATYSGSILGEVILQAMLADAREEFRDTAKGMSRNDDARLMDAVENAATLRRVDALCYLHQLLKLWVAPHVLFTSIMLMLNG